MRVEKRAANKAGVIVVVILIVALVLGGGYYLFTHKDSLNIDWDINLPWAKDSDSGEEKEIDSAGKSSTKKKNKSFVVPAAVSSPSLPRLEYNYIRLNGIKGTAEDVVIEMTYTSKEDGKTAFRVRTNSRIEIYRCVTEGFEVPCKSEAEVLYGQQKDFELHISKFDLRNLELEGLNSLTIYYKEYNLLTQESKAGFETISFRNETGIDNSKSLLLISTLKIDEGNNIHIKYYKTVTDKLNTYLYFVAENRTRAYNVVIKPKRVMINDKVYEPKKVEATAYLNSSTMFFITIPKSEFKTVKKINVSFFAIADIVNEEYTSYAKKVYLISNEYIREL